MYTGTMMADLMAAVERAEQSAPAMEEVKPWPAFAFAPELSLEAERETIFAGAA